MYTLFVHWYNTCAHISFTSHTFPSHTRIRTPTGPTIITHIESSWVSLAKSKRSSPAAAKATQRRRNCVNNRHSTLLEQRTLPLAPLLLLLEVWLDTDHTELIPARRLAQPPPLASTTHYTPPATAPLMAAAAVSQEELILS